MNNDLHATILKVTGGLGIAMLTPEEWAALATCTYFFVQTAYLLWKWRNESRDRKNKK